LIVSTPSFAGSDDYFVIAGNPSSNHEQSLATTLFQLDRTAHAVNFRRTITTLRQGAELIRNYTDLGLVLVASRGGPGRVQFDLVHYDEVMHNHQLEIVLDARTVQFKDRGYPLDVLLMHSENGGWVVGVEENIFDETHHLSKSWVTGVGVDGQVSVLAPTRYLDIYSSGWPSGLGGGLNNEVKPDHYRAFGEIDGVFRLGFTGGLVNAPFAGPDLTKYEMKIGLVQVINNGSIRVLTGPQLFAQGGHGAYLVQDKTTGRWSELPVDGDDGSLTAFGDRLAYAVGFQQTDYPGEHFDTTIAPVPDVESPYFVNSKERLFHSHATGRIVLRDLSRDLITEFTVPSRDFDVLWLAEDRVLYRVESCIYERTWSAQGLGEAKLLVRDDEIVPAIHWAFLSAGAGGAEPAVSR